MEEFIYPKCQKAKHHRTESLNLVCFDKSCTQQRVICDICYEQYHEGHQIKPLKSVINNAKRKSEEKSDYKVGNHIMNLMNNHQLFITEQFKSFATSIKKQLQEIQTDLLSMYKKFSCQFKTSSKDARRQSLKESLRIIGQQQLPYDTFNSLMQNFLQNVDELSQQPKVSAEEEISNKTMHFCKRYENQFLQKVKMVEKQMKIFSTFTQNISRNDNILDYYQKFAFSHQLKHPTITIKDMNVVKSTLANSYRIALLAPALLENTKQSLKAEFFIKKKVSKWVAVGVCYRNRLRQSNFVFESMNKNHGGYMLSSNGGFWSQVDTANNGKFFGFQFFENDHITVEHNPTNKQIIFKKIGGKQSKTMTYQELAEDDLHFCALFYFQDDEIQFQGVYND